MNIKIIQGAGLGDILFGQKIAVRLMQLGHKVYWPLDPVLNYISEYVKNGVIWESLPYAEEKLDLQNASSIVGLDRGWMIAKYTLANKSFDIGSHEDWADYIACEDGGKQFPVPTKPYNAIVDVFGTPPGIYRIKIPVKGVRVDISDEYNPFNYRSFFENAEEIHVVDTCFSFLIEKWDTSKVKKLCLYPRHPFWDHITTGGLWKKSWEFKSRVDIV